MKLLVTGSSGLIGSEVCRYFAQLGWTIHGVDNNQREVFFGPQGTTRWNQRRLQAELADFEHHELDVRDRNGILGLVERIKPDAIVHTAAQPSHDRAAAIPFDDFDTNAVGTLNLLEAARRSCPASPFVHMSTNKVYGDRPNTIALKELETRWDYADPDYQDGISEEFSIDAVEALAVRRVQGRRRRHGAGVRADISACRPAAFRGGCLTGPNHAGVELHGFLSYLVKCNLEEREYRVFGYKGKQVRDNIHSLDVARFIAGFIAAPRSGEVYNLGGGRNNSCSILEAFDLVERVSGKAQRYSYVDENRVGDHICYISNLSKMRAHYPQWDITVSLEETIGQLALGDAASAIASRFETFESMRQGRKPAPTMTG